MADLEPLQRSMIDAARLLGIPTAGSPPPTWAELGAQVHAAVRDTAIVCERAAIYHAAVTKLLGYEPCPTEEGAKAAAADLLGRGFAEAAAQVGRCARELGYVGEPATLASAVGDACLAFARELREINARYMVTVKRLEAEVDALTLAQEEALTAFQEHGWTGTIPDGPAAVPAHARDLIGRYRELTRRFEARTASLLPDEIADLRRAVNAAACQGEITTRRNDELVGALARCQDNETARLRRELAAAEKLADAWKASAFALRAAHVRQEDIAANRLEAVASPASPHSMQTDSETGTTHLGFSMPRAGGLAIRLTCDDAVRLRGWLINAAGLPSIEPRERSLRAVSGAVPGGDA